MNFFDIVEPHLKMLTKNEQVLFDYVVSNMNKIKVSVKWQEKRMYRQRPF